MACNIDYEKLLIFRNGSGSVRRRCFSSKSKKMTRKNILFQLGKLTWTRTVNNTVADSTPFSKFVLACLRRHAMGDWGKLCEEDKAENELSLKEGFRIQSNYPFPENIKSIHPDGRIWIITEGDRSATTILFPSEY